MTLGGLALAVGVLVDEGTVLLENIHVHLGSGETVRGPCLLRKPRSRNTSIARDASVLAVFIPSFFMTGPAQSLFLPLSLAVGFFDGRFVPALQFPGSRPCRIGC